MGATANFKTMNNIKYTGYGRYEKGFSNNKAKPEFVKAKCYYQKVTFLFLFSNTYKRDTLKT